MLSVDGDSVVVGSSALSDEHPVSLLLLEVKTGGVGDEEEGGDPAGETEPADDPEPGSRVGDVVVDDGGGEGTELARGRSDTVSGGSDRDGEDLGGEEEGGAARRDPSVSECPVITGKRRGHSLGTELLEERGEVVDGLETVNVCLGLEVLEPN